MALTSQQLDAYAATTSAITRCLKITRADTTEHFFTALDSDVTISGDTYIAVGGFTATAYEAATGLSVDNAEIAVLTDALGLTDDEIIAGRLDGARWEVFEYDFGLDLVLKTVGGGVLGEYEHSSPGFSIELRSLSQFLNGSIGNILKKKCRHDLYDSICRVTTVGNTFVGTVTVATSRLTFTVDTPPDRALGRCTFTSGDNTGVIENIRVVSGSVITLDLPLPFDLQVGDAYSITNGCNKTLSQCRDDYDNVLNYGGAHHAPGNDALRAPPDPR